MSARRDRAAEKRRTADSPKGRRAIRERAEAAALAEVRFAARERYEKTQQLRQLRLEQNED